jgi:hypothetical protein
MVEIEIIRLLTRFCCSTTTETLSQCDNIVLAPFWSAKHSTRTMAVPSAQGRTVRAQRPDGPRPGARRGGALCTGAVGPRAGAGRSTAWCEARASA